jgi:hypothetical protein
MNFIFKTTLRERQTGEALGLSNKSDAIFFFFSFKAVKISGMFLPVTEASHLA